MAINKNTEWKNENTLILAATGGGKSQMMNQIPGIPYRGARCIFWDPEPDHRARHFSTRNEFISALKQAIKWADQKPETRGYRIAYKIPDTMPKTLWNKEFEWWCSVVWAVLDGRYRTNIFCEEMSSVSLGAGPASPYHGLLMERCRKYGGRFIGSTQRSQKIPKDCFDACDIQYIGKHKPGRAANFTANACDVLIDLVPLEDMAFTVIKPGEATKQIKIPYQVIDTTG